MATGKKSFIAYADWKNTFDELDNENAGALIKHIFAYVNDESPISDSVLIRAIFANIKATLKRDLDKWDTQLIQRSEAGKKSAELRALNKFNERSTVVESRARNPTDSVSVSVNDNVIKENNSIDTRKLKFAHTLKPFLDIYSKETIREFYDYWTEPNKSNTKFRQELQKTWSVNRRLETWNNNNFNKQQNGKSKITDSKQFGEIVEAIRSTGERI
jgi:hypothetical protein